MGAAVMMVVIIASLPTPARATTTYGLTVTKTGSGGGGVTSSPPGIDCGATCSASFDATTIVTLTPSADTHSTFVGWGGACSGTGLCQVTMNQVSAVSADFELTYRADALIKRAPGHPWHGEGVFNTTGAHQTVSGSMEEGTNIHFWIVLENDGTSTDTLYLNGCNGNGSFVVWAYIIGAFVGPTPAPHITAAAKAGTWHVTLPANSDNKTIITLSIWAKTAVRGARYTCPITVSSAAVPSVKDTVVAKMVTI